jgi:peptidyl-prolyl cis-trans isomerase SurA
MKAKFLKLLVIVFLFSSYFTKAQVKDTILMTVAGENVTKSEFIGVFKKNNVKGSEKIDKKSLEEYLDLYINFKLKVKEAEEMGLDTATSFKTELIGYRKQLAQPYLTDRQVDDDLLMEAYERMKFDVRAEHILVSKIIRIKENKTTKKNDTTYIKIDKNSAPEDTLEAYKKILKIRERIMKGEPFEKLAMELSDDPSARDREDAGSKTIITGNGGDLGYFSVLDMVYPFETGAYTTKVGNVSMPIRTDFGYHLIKVTDKMPAMGKVTVAHIFVAVPKDAKPQDFAKYKIRIEEAYTKVKEGAKFEDVVNEYSDDKGSAAKGGALPAFGVSRMVPEFIVAISKLNNTGDISQPIQTVYGWHIIKILDKKGVKTFEDEKSGLKTRVLRDGRANRSKESIIIRIKAEYTFKEIADSKKEFYSVVDTSLLNGRWDAARANNLNKVMFTLAGKDYTQQDFSKYLALHQGKKSKSTPSAFVNDIYKKYVEDICINYEDNRLEAKYPEFKSLMKEYRDGILLFELTDKKVWSKAIKDTLGLQDYYSKYKQNYMWDVRADASIYTCIDMKTAKEARKLVAKVLKGKMTETELLKKINIDSIPALKIDRKLYLKKENAKIDSMKWEKSIGKDFIKGSTVTFIVINDVILPLPKTIKEARGLITADYQNFLEKEWIEGLRKKYSVQVYREVFDSIK